MEKPTRLPATTSPALDADAPGARSAETRDAKTGAATPPAKNAGARFVGSAMKTLFESSDVSIKRGDETRVMSRAQEQLEELHRRYPNAAMPSRTPGDDSVRSPTPSEPPRPRVDVVLWIVLAVGLFGIAGWMIASGLH